MTFNKKIALGAVLLLVVGGIWYLEHLKAVQAPQTGAPKTITAASIMRGAPGETFASIEKFDKDNGYQPAIELADPTGFINTDPLHLADLVGKKVILVDFWTYSCINCIRTIPYLNAWYDKYRDQGLEIVGVHTPEFEFEKNIDNVRTAVKKYGIKYPVVLDSNSGTWQAYQNLYWPHEYLIDIAGYIVRDHIGEGGYEGTEMEIQKLLKERAEALGTAAVATTRPVSAKVAADNLTGIQSPETYFGAGHNEHLANGSAFTVGIQQLTEPKDVSANNLYLAGQWSFEKEFATNVSAGAKIIYKYHSGKVFFVAAALSGATVEVLQDGVPVAGAAGSDVQNGKITVKESRLYNVIANPDGPGDHTLEFIIDSPGLQAYTFTFG